MLPAPPRRSRAPSGTSPVRQGIGGTAVGSGVGVAVGSGVGVAMGGFSSSGVAVGSPPSNPQASALLTSVMTASAISRVCRERMLLLLFAEAAQGLTQVRVRSTQSHYSMNKW